MHISITKEQFVNFVLNDVNEDERKKIIEAINTNTEAKERYLYEKRKHDVERYINDEMDIGESCEIEELLKMDSRLYDHFVLNTEPNDEVQNETINPKQNSISKEQLVNFIFNDVVDEEYIKEYVKINEAINANPITKEIYLFEKRKYDVERYIDDKMNFGERCEIEELFKINSRICEYFELKKGVVEEEQDVKLNHKHIVITKEQLVNFVLDNVNDEEREKISEAINTKSLIKEKYLFEKRKYDIERYIDDEMSIGERCEIEELIKMDSRLFDYFELHCGVIEEEQDEIINLKQIPVTNEQLVNFVLNDVTEEEHKKIKEAINTNPVTKERYLFEKRKHDIERYISDEMDIGERCEIEELFKTNSRLFEHFELNKDIIEFLQTTLKEQINDIHTELYDAIHNNEDDKIEDEVSPVKDTVPVIKLKPKILRISKWVAAASLILFVSTIGMNYITSNQNTVEEKLYNKYYEPFRPNANNFFKSSTLIKAKNKYNNQEYDIAWLLIEELPGSMTIEAEKTLYSGLTLMELKRFNNAIDKFEFLQTSEEKTAIHSISQWYLALCYLNTEKRTEATAILKNIVANKTYNYSDAKKILKKLN